MMLEPSNFTMKHFTLKALIRFAYQIGNNAQLAGGPAWMNTTYFDVTAKPEPAKIEELDTLPPAQRMQQIRLMLQSLLADRFALKTTMRTEQLPAYGLVVAKGGSKMQEVEAGAALPAKAPAILPLATALAPPPPPPPSGAQASAGGFMRFGYTDKNRITASNAPMSVVVSWLSGQPEIGGRLIVDETGLTGKYNFVLDGVPPSRPTEDWSGASVFTLMREQLGLTLRPEKAPTQVLVVEHAEPASAN